MPVWLYFVYGTGAAVFGIMVFLSSYDEKLTGVEELAIAVFWPIVVPIFAMIGLYRLNNRFNKFLEQNYENMKRLKGKDE